MPPLRADVPQTDREAMIQLMERLDNVLEKLQGKDGVCDVLKKHDKQINDLQNWRWYIIGGMSLATFVLVALRPYIDLGGHV